MFISDPKGQRRLFELNDRIEVKLWSSNGSSFHPKAYLLDYDQGQGLLIVGSSNLSVSAYRLSVEWNLRGLTRHSEEIHNSFNDVLTALNAPPLEPERLKCWDCGKRFILEVEEQKFFQLKGYESPKRCPACRERKWLSRMGIDPD